MSVIPKRAKDQVKESLYMKFTEAKSTFRALTDSIDGFLWWTGEEGKRKPNRVLNLKEVPVDYRSGEDMAKYFIAFLVWNYNKERAEILELTQVSIFSVLESLEADDNWGDLKGFDVVIKKTGQGLETRYEVLPIPPKPFDRKGKDIPEVTLEALYEGEDPFRMDAKITDDDSDSIAKDL